MKKLNYLLGIFVLSTLLCFGSEKTFKGKVLEVETQKPISQALVFLYDFNSKLTEMTFTNDKGEFEFQKINADVVYFKVNRLGYDGAEFGPVKASRKDFPKKIKFILTPIPHSTEQVIVKADSPLPPLVQSGFYQRKDMGIGKSLTFKDFEKQNVNTLQSLFNRFPNIRYDSSRDLLYTLTNRSMHGDNVIVYLDGISLDPDIPLSTTINVENIAGVEVFTHISQMPLQYKKLNATGGIVLLWTK